MKTGKTKLIPENIAPPDAVGMAIFNGDTRICHVGISAMRPQNLGEKRYSFGLVSDMHLDGAGIGSDSGERLSEAMTFFENQGCSFCCHAGDMTNFGFWKPISETEHTSYYYPAQMAEYKSVLEAHPNLPMHGICGNHESYNNYSIIGTYTDVYGADPTLTVNTPDKLKEYTGLDLYYTYTHGDDVFVFFGQPGGTTYVEKEAWKDGLRWLQSTLEANRDKRCFVFEHLTLSDDSGNPNNIHNAFWYDLEDTLVGIMRHYKNAMLFHGHSHLDFNEQLNWTYANYSTRKGFRSVSIPSSAGSRVTADGVLVKENLVAKRGGYIADVYDHCVILKGYYFADSKPAQIAQYRIDTTLQTVEAGTFTDSTGIINA